MTVSSSAPRVFIIDQSLRNSTGHHLEYSVAARDAFASAKFDSQIFCNKYCDPNITSSYRLHPHFQEIWTERTRASTFSSLVWTLLTLLGIRFPIRLPARSFGRDLQSLVRFVCPKRRDHFFVHTLNFVQLIQIAQVISAEKIASSFHVVLRQDPDEAKRVGLKEMVLKAVFRIFDGFGGIHFYSDTTSLCRVYEERYRVRFSRLPILFDQLPFASQLKLAPSKNGAESTIVAFLGDGRLEKGFQHLPEVIEQTWRLNNRVTFKVQAHLTGNNKAAPALNKTVAMLSSLAAANPSKLHLIERSLDQGEYLNVLFASNLVLIPYDQQAYRMRSSGILAQALAAGKMVVLPRGTALESDSIEDVGEHFGRLCFLYNDVSEIPKLLAAANALGDQTQVRMEIAERFGKAHSAKQFVETILRSSNL